MSVQDITPLLLHYKYIIMLGLMILEGPIVSFIAAFLAAKGYFSFGLVYLLSVSGDIIGDAVRYRLGRFARAYGDQEHTHKSFFTRPAVWIAHKIQTFESSKAFAFIHKHMHQNFISSLFIVKITPPISTPGHIAFGFFRIPFFKFLTRTALICLLFESVFLNLGYRTSISVNAVQKNFDLITQIISSLFI
jgi:membrane protein DedA with SNARE-associated domain